MLTAICIVLLVLGFLSFTMIIEAKLNLDIYGGENFLSFYLLGIKVVGFDVDFARDEANFFKFKLRNGENIIATLSLSDVDVGSARDTFRQALPNPFYNLDVVDVDVYAEYGGSNAFNTVFAVGALRNLISGVLLYFLSTQKVRAISQVKPNFDNRAIILRISSIFCLTLADIIYGVIFCKKGEERNDIGK